MRFALKVKLNRRKLFIQIFFAITLLIVACNRAPERHISVKANNENPIDFSAEDSTIFPIGTASSQTAKERMLELENNYKKWWALKPVHYRYKYMFFCDCRWVTINVPKRYIPSVSVEVDEKSIKVVDFDKKEVARLVEINKNGDPIEGLFDYLKNSKYADEYIVKFDDELGFPKEVYIEQSKQSTSALMYAEVFNFAPLR